MFLAVTSWLALGAYHLLARGGRDEVGMEMFDVLSALVAVWSLFAIVAVHWTHRRLGEAWSFFAMLVGLAAAFSTMTAALYPIAFTRAVLARPLDAARPLPLSVAATDPLGVMSLGATGLYFLVVGLLLWRCGSPRRLALLALLSATALLLGLFDVLGAQRSTAMAATLLADAVFGPVFWIWMGLRIRRAA